MSDVNFMIATCGQSNDTCPDIESVYTRWRKGVKQFSYDGSNVWEAGTDPMTLEGARGASYRPNLSHYLRGKYTGIKLGICTSGVSGTSLQNTWANPASAGYIAFKARTLAAASAAGLTLSATNFIIMFIGMEGDVAAGRSAAQIKADMDTMVAQMRSDFSVPALKVFFTAPYDSARIAASAIVKTGIENAESADSNIHLMADLASYKHLDTVHISKEGNDVLGTDEGSYIDSVIDLSKYKKSIPSSSAYANAQYLDESYYIIVGIDYTKIPSNQTFFPLVMGSAHLPPDFWNNISSGNGIDVVFTSISGTKLEIEKVNIDQATESMTVWFQASELLSATDAKILIQFGSSRVTETSSVNTWKNCYGGSINYLRAFHCEEASGNLTDSVGGSTGTATDITYGETLKINNGIGLDNANGNVDVGLLTELSNIQNFTIKFWMIQNTVDRDDYMIAMTPGGADGIWIYTSAAGTGVLYFSIWDGALGRIAVKYVDDGITSGQLFSLSAVFDGTLAAANRAKLYFDGVLQAATPTTVPAQTPTFVAGNFYIGRSGGGVTLDGDMDEVMVILGSLTQDQITIHQNNESQFSTNNIFTFGDVTAFVAGQSESASGIGSNGSTRANVSELRAKEQASQESDRELLRNFHNRVMIDGSEDFKALQYLQGIAANLYSLGLGPESTNVVVEADTDAHLLVDCKPNQRIIVFDILLSINAASVISFEDSDGNEILARMYAPNAGQGFTMNSVRGQALPRNTGLFVQSSNAINYSVDCSYAIIEDVG